MKLTTRRIAFAGILAALYTVVTLIELLIYPELPYAAVQFRIAEALAVLCCFTPAAIPGMVIGCVVSNFFSPVGAWDIVIGSFATLLASVVTWLMSRSLRTMEHSASEAAKDKKLSLRKLLVVLLVPLPTILFNAFIVGAEITLVYPAEGEAFWTAYGANALSVGLGEAAVLYVLGVPLLIWLLKNKSLFRLMRSF